VNLAAADIEVDMIERERSGEALDQPRYLEQRRRSALTPSLMHVGHERLSGPSIAKRDGDAGGVVPRRVA